MRALITGDLSALKPYWASKLSSWASSQGNSGQGTMLILVGVFRESPLVNLRVRACALDTLDVPPDFNLKIVSNSLTRLHKEVEEDSGGKMVRFILVIVVPSP